MGLFLKEKLSKFYNSLDFIDKILITLAFLIGAVFSVVPVFASESESVTVSSVPYIGFNSNSSVFVEASSTTAVGYFLVEPGYKYIITNNSSSTDKDIGFSSDIPALGGSVNHLGKITRNGGTFEFNGTSYGYLYFDFYTYATVVSVSRVKLSGMEDTIDNMYYNVGVNNLWNVFNMAVPYILIVVLCSIGLFIIRRFIMKFSKGKSGVI